MTSKQSDSNRKRASQRRSQQGWRAFVDLFAVLALVVLTNLLALVPIRGAAPLLPIVDVGAFVSSPDTSFVRAVVGTVFVLFLPGYAFISALFPEAWQSDTTDAVDETGGDTLFGSFTRNRLRRLDGIERVALAFGVSIAIAPVLFIGFSLFSIEFGAYPTVLVLSGLTIVCIEIAAIRRWHLPEEERFYVPFEEWSTTVKQGTTGANSVFGAALNVALAVAIVLAVGTLAFAVVAPPDGERFTDFYVLNENSEGELVAASYPGVLSPGEPEQIHIGIENHEQDTHEYFIVVQLHRVQSREDGVVVTQRHHIEQFSVTLAAGNTSTQQVEITPPNELVGDDLRLTFLLYADSVPESPNRANAYRSLHLWVDIQAEEV